MGRSTNPFPLSGAEELAKRAAGCGQSETILLTTIILSLLQGEGSFGVIFEGTNLLNSQTVAIKFEPRKSDAPQLRDEYRTYKILAGCCEYSFGLLIQ